MTAETTTDDAWYSVDIDDVEYGSTHLSGRVAIAEPTIPHDDLIDNIVARIEQHNVGYSRADVRSWDLDAVVERAMHLLPPEYITEWRVDGRYLTLSITDREPYASQMVAAVDLDDESSELGRALWRAVTATHHDQITFNEHDVPDEWDVVHKISQPE